MKATARAWGAVSVVNAIATGRGASLAVDLHTRATVQLVEDAPDVRVTIHGDETEDPRLAREVVRAVLDRLDLPYGAHVETDSTIPIGRGLKSSSAAANAIGLATNQAARNAVGRSLPRDTVLDATVDAALKAGVTITGAYDDASASFHGGLCVTDNPNRELLARHEIPTTDDLVCILHAPPRKTHTASVRGRPYKAIAPVAARAHALALCGEWQDAMTLNGLAYGAVYGIDPAPLLDALERGAVAASVSGTGPALAAVAPADRAAHIAEAFEPLEGLTRIVSFVNTPAEVIS